MYIQEREQLFLIAFLTLYTIPAPEPQFLTHFDVTKL